MLDMESALEPLSIQITDLEENIASIVRRNDIVDGEIQGIKSDMTSLTDKILAIKVSSKIFTKFPGNPILEILIKFCNCVDGANVRGCCPTKVCPSTICNCPLILRYF